MSHLGALPSACSRLPLRGRAVMSEAVPARRSEPSAASATAAATEHGDAALAKGIMRRAAGVQLLVRIVDHASGSLMSASNRTAALCRRVGWRTRADLACDQPMDACGYIAADIVSRLREAALSQPDGWMSAPLPDYCELACVRRGEAVLRRPSADRVLESDDVNLLVRTYSHLVEHTQAHEEWWGGAVALDHFLESALSDFLDSLRGADSSGHRWRAWVVNTQT